MLEEKTTRWVMKFSEPEEEGKINLLFLGQHALGRSKEHKGGRILKREGRS